MVGIDTTQGQTEALDRLPSYKVLLHDLLGVSRMDKAIPNPLRIDHHHGSMFTLVEAPSLVDPDTMLQTRGLDSVLERTPQFLAIFVRATRPRCGFVPLIHADKDVVFVIRHDLLDATRTGPDARYPAFLQHPNLVNFPEARTHGGPGSARIDVYGF